MGRDFKSLTTEDNPIADAFLELLRPEFRRLVFLSLHFVIPEWIIRRLPLKENDLLNNIGGYLRNVCNDIIVEKKGDLQKTGDVAEHDILSRIIQTGEFSDEEVSHQMVTFLAAGVCSQSVPLLPTLQTPNLCILTKTSTARDHSQCPDMGLLSVRQVPRDPEETPRRDP